MQRFFSAVKSNSLTILGLTALCTLAFVLRWPAVYFALPYTPHPDEPYVINIVLRMLASGSLFPDSFDRPHLSVYPVWAAVWLDNARHAYPTALLAVPTDRITQLVEPFVVGRITSIALSILAIPLVYVVLRRQGHMSWAWIGAAWLTLLPFHIAQSGYIAPDGLVAVVTLLLLLVTDWYVARPSATRWWVVSLVVGLAIGTKYNLAAIVLIPAAAQWELLRTRHWGTLVRVLLVLGVGAVVGFFVTTPGLLVQAGQFVADMQSQVSHYSRHDAGNRPWDWPFYVQFFWAEGWPFLSLPLVLIGFWQLVKTREPRAVALVLFLGIELLFFLSRERHYMRNLMPLVVTAPLALAAGASWLQQRWPTRWLTPLLAFVCLAPLAWEAAQQYATMQLPYNRLVVDQYVGTLPAGAARVCSLDQFTVANTPSCAAATNKPAELTQWLHAGVQSYVTTGEPPVPPGMTVQHTVPDTARGGNGEGFLVATRDPHTALVTTGPTAQTSDGLRIDGVRLAASPPRARMSPLEAAATVTRSAADTTLAVNLYATVTAAVTEPEWWLFVHLVDADGTVVSQRATVPRGDYAIASWQVGELVIIPADLALPADLPAGAYTLQLGFYRPSDGARMVVDGFADGTWSTAITLR